MSGTVAPGVIATSTGGDTVTSPVRAGDYVTWTLQYDPSIPPHLTSVPQTVAYFPAGPVISNLVDQTSGLHLSTPSTGLESSLLLANPGSPGDSYFLAGDSQISSNPNPLKVITYQASLVLFGPSNGFSTLDLSQFALDRQGIQMTVPDGAFSHLTYYGGPNGAGGDWLNFAVQVTSLSPAVSTPEPASLTLFLLGTAGFAVRRLRLWAGVETARRRVNRRFRYAFGAGGAPPRLDHSLPRPLAIGATC